jgi:negative regulator of sigma E activity
MLTDSDEKVVSYDDGQYLWRFFPHKNLVIKESTRQPTLKPLQSAEKLELVRRNYHIKVVGIYYVNSRTGYRIRFTPKTADRPQQVYWIDATTGVPLKIEKYGPQDQLVSVSSFSDLEFNVPNNQGLFLMRVPSHTLVAEVNEEGNLSLRRARRLMGQQVSIPDYLPTGFVEKNICFKSQGTKKVLQIFYSDGLSSLSVYQQPYEEKDLARVERASTRISVKGRDAFLSTSGTLHTLTVPAKPISSTLMGEIFPTEITKIAGSLYPHEATTHATPASHPRQ